MTKRHKEIQSFKIRVYEELVMQERQTIIIIPQYKSLLKKKDVLVLKAIIASYHKGKMFDLVAHGDNIERVKDLEESCLYLIHNVFICWHKSGKKKMARIERYTGNITKLKNEQLSTYGQQFNWFSLEWHEKKITTNYQLDNIEFLNVAGYIMSDPVKQKNSELYRFWIKNQHNAKIMINYFSTEQPKKIKKHEIFIFTCLKPNVYTGRRTLTINGPWYKVPWKWKFDGDEINVSSKAYHKATG